MKRVLLTGLAGSIGVHVVSHIMLNTDWDIVGIDSFRHKGYGKRLDYLFGQYPEWQSRVKIFQHDLTCPISPSLKEQIGDIDYILHLAAISDVFFSVENPIYVIKNNIDSAITMIEYARQTPHEVFVYFSTDEVYGPVKPGEAHKEWDAHRGSNAYSASKAASEDLFYPFWRSGEINLILTNTMNNHGEMQSPSKFPMMIQRAVEAGDEVTIHGTPDNIGSRFYIHSRNAADALLFILKRGAYEHKIGELDDPLRYHIVGDAHYNNLELAQLIADLMGKKLKYKFVDFHSHNPAHDIHYGLQDNNLRPAGWKEPVSDKDSLKKEIQWNKDHAKEWL